MIFYDIGIAWQNVRHRPVGTLIPVLVVGLALALAIAVIALADAGQQGLIQASDPFGMVIVGPAGSGQQLVLSSILLQDNPIGNMPHSVYSDLRGDPRVALAVPLVFGDNVAGARLIGTDASLFSIRRSRSAPPTFQIVEGRTFADVAPAGATDDAGEGRDGLFEAVLGANAARRLGLRIGDRFVATHGVGRGIAENTHEDAHTVVGILAPTTSAYDSAVFTHYESIWQAHRPDVLAMRSFALPSAEPIILEQVTAVLVSAVGFIEQNQIVQQYYAEPTLQAAFPGAELVNLITLLNQGQQILNLIAYLVLGIAGLTLFLSMYGAIQARQQAIAIMRSVGGSRQNIFRVVIFETLLVSIAGALLGRLLGYGLALVIASVYSDQVSVPLPVRYLWDFEPVLWTLSIGVGILAGLVPAAIAYRVNVVETLFPS